MDSTQVATSPVPMETLIYQFQSFQFSSDVVYYVALAIGFFIIAISYIFGGGKTNRLKVMISIIIGSLIGILTLPLLLKIAGTEEPSAVLVSFLLAVDLIFASAVTCHLYELVVVRASEAFSGKDA